LGNLVPALIDGIDRALLREICAVVPAGNRSLVLIEGIALAQLGQKSANDKRYDGPLGRIVRVGPDGVDEAGRAISSGLLLDTRSFMLRLIKGLKASAAMSDLTQVKNSRWCFFVTDLPKMHFLKISKFSPLLVSVLRYLGTIQHQTDAKWVCPFMA
jgi:hypothetical protein